MYVITGGTGKVGRQLTRLLLARRKPVRVIGRDSDTLDELAALGAQPVAGELTDSELLARAFTGATAVFTVVPTDPATRDLRAFQARVGEAEVAAIAGAGVRRVVSLSSLGADLDSGTGPVLGLHDQEERLATLGGVDVLHLRPTYFMENLLGSVGIIRAQGVNGGPLEPEVAFPVVATRDVAAVAAEHLLGADWHGHAFRELLGPEDLTMERMTAEIGRGIGKLDLRYVQYPYADVEKGMMAVGFSDDVARSYTELARAINERRAIAARPRTRRTTTPTRFRTFVEEVFVPAYEARRPAPGPQRASPAPPP